MADKRTRIPNKLADEWQAAQQAINTAEGDWSAFLSAHPDVAALADKIAEHYHRTGRPYD